MTTTAFLNRLLTNVEWEPLEFPEAMSEADSDAQVTHRGILKVEDFEIGCYRLTDGEIALDIEDIERFFAGCPLCNHSSRCPDCNPTPEERQEQRLGVCLNR